MDNYLRINTALMNTYYLLQCRQWKRFLFRSSITPFVFDHEHFWQPFLIFFLLIGFETYLGISFFFELISGHTSALGLFPKLRSSCLVLLPLVFCTHVIVNYLMLEFLYLCLYIVDLKIAWFPFWYLNKVFFFSQGWSNPGSASMSCAFLQVLHFSGPRKLRKFSILAPEVVKSNMKYYFSQVNNNQFFESAVNLHLSLRLINMPAQIC